MAQTTRRVGNFLGVGNFAAKVLVEGLWFRANIYWPLDGKNGYTTTLPLEVFTLRRFVADFIRLNLNVIK